MLQGYFDWVDFFITRFRLVKALNIFSFIIQQYITENLWSFTQRNTVWITVVIKRKLSGVGLKQQLLTEVDYLCANI